MPPQTLFALYLVLPALCHHGPDCIVFCFISFNLFFYQLGANTSPDCIVFWLSVLFYLFYQLSATKSLDCINFCLSAFFPSLLPPHQLIALSYVLPAYYCFYVPACCHHSPRLHYLLFYQRLIHFFCQFVPNTATDYIIFQLGATTTPDCLRPDVRVDQASSSLCSDYNNTIPGFLFNPGSYSLI